MILLGLKITENNLEVKMPKIMGLIREVVILGDAKEILVQIDSDPVSYTHLTLPTIYSV